MTTASLGPDESTTAPVAIAGAVTALALILIAAGFLLIEGSGTTPLLASLSFLLVFSGIVAPSRAAVVLGAVVLVATTLQFSSAQSLGSALIVNSLMAIVTNAIVVLADFSFNARRGLSVSPQTVQGYALSYAVAVLGGVAFCAAIVAVVQSQAWPQWLLVVVAGCLAVVVAVVLGWSVDFRRRFADGPPPPRPGD